MPSRNLVTLRPREDLSWQAAGVCQVSHLDWFTDDPAERQVCARICVRECPVRMQCLNYATQNREPWGVWGGEVFLSGLPGSVRVDRRRKAMRERIDDLLESTPSA